MNYNELLFSMARAYEFILYEWDVIITGQEPTYFISLRGTDDSISSETSGNVFNYYYSIKGTP